jgi:hypothetical protein
LDESKTGADFQPKEVPQELRGLIDFLAELLAEVYLKEHNLI